MKCVVVSLDLHLYFRVVFVSLFVCNVVILFYFGSCCAVMSKFQSFSEYFMKDTFNSLSEHNNV